MLKFIKIKLQVEGLHNWPQAAEVFPDVGFLSYPHRHIFYITLTKQVTHNDRHIEIIRFKREILGYLKNKYSNGEQYLDFGRKSCEDIAEELLTQFNLNTVEVLEDDENGAILTR